MDVSSDLSALTRTPSPTSHYHTAFEGTSSRGEAATDFSSPGEAEAEAADVDYSVKTPYRDALSLPRELRLRCQIHIEEQYYVAALNLLNTTLCEGISHAYTPTESAPVPPPLQLGVLATLAIHPKHTSKLANLDAHDVSSLSLSYLRSVLATVGPVNAKLRDAFLFREEEGGRSARARKRRNVDSSTLQGSHDDEEDIRGKIANAGSIWARGQNFWNVLGWAFNCSAVYPHRWRWWKPWLEFILDVLEADYEERRRLDEECEEKEAGDKHCMLPRSLLMSYVIPKNHGSNPLQPIMSALFADGNSSSLLVHKEVFAKEVRVPSKNNRKRKHYRVNLENDEFGDYDDDSSTGGSEPPTPENQRTSGKGKHPISWADTALAESVPLRLRVFALLSRAAYDLKDECRFTLPDLYEGFARRIRGLPLPAFAAFLAGHDSPLEGQCVIAILRNLLPALLPDKAPGPHKVDPEADACDNVSPAILERCYLPFAYKTADNNARISIAVEVLFRIMWGAQGTWWTSSLHKAVVTGIKAREDKSSTKGGSKDDGNQHAREMLRASASRLKAMSEILKAQTQEGTI